MDPILSSFVLQMTAVGVASCIGVIGAFSKCFQRSRCLNIKSPCISCDRSVLDVDSEVYLDTRAT
jgi:hypothetical protein